jgi:hypothetical protein
MFSVERTSYLGVAGYFGNLPGSATAAQFEGLFANRTRHRFADVSDGISNVLLFGEATGGQEGSRRRHAFAWIGAGILVTAYDLKDSAWHKFDSEHPGIVQFALADGSLRPLAVNIARDAYLSLGGKHDGAVPDGDFTK